MSVAEAMPLAIERAAEFFASIPGSPVGPSSARKQTGTYAESNGYYERVPIRVNEFTLETNEEGCVVFKTTSQAFCDDGPMLTVTISNDDSGWSVEVNQGPYHWSITSSVDLHKERLARRRAFWHAAQYMSGRDLTHRERFTISYKANNDEADLFKDDAFFQNGDAVTTDPFGAFLED